MYATMTCAAGSTVVPLPIVVVLVISSITIVATMTIINSSYYAANIIVCVNNMYGVIINIY